ncbi:protein FAM107B isoform X3 [Thalassophryne amazonica]|uniref:protein FAM107B isoform X3 n=1 Tax=Thalassophryne amazonica TaxID=390379 RepID=UPI001470C853|nr:protein FAM107B isoform X3 [Thalassophryne amazonica]
MEAPNTKKKPGHGQHRKADYIGEVKPRKLNGSSVETPSHQDLHRELLLSHKRGLLLEEKPELKRVLDQRRLDLHKVEELAKQGPSDLETELRKRQQKLQEVKSTRQATETLNGYEQEEIRQRENEKKIPEFVRVKDNLRRTQTFEQ